MSETDPIGLNGNGNGGLTEKTRTNLPLIAIIAGAIFIAQWSGTFVTKYMEDRQSTAAEVETVRTEFDARLAKFSSAIDKRFTEFSHELKNIVGALKQVNERVVGRTPEGFHRRDCQDVVNAIASAISNQVASGDYEREAWLANRVILRAMATVDCYSLPGTKSRIASQWSTIVKPTR